MNDLSTATNFLCAWDVPTHAVAKKIVSRNVDEVFFVFGSDL